MRVTTIQEIIIYITSECTLIVVFVHTIWVNVIVDITVPVSAAVDVVVIIIVVVIAVITFCIDLLTIFIS